MKILVFSDSHGSRTNMLSAMEKHYPNIDLIIHLGDGAKEFSYLSDSYPELKFFGVRGNCDINSPKELMTTNILELDNCRILCTHGHEYNVKYSLDNLFRCAVDKKCDVALFGHTHRAYRQYFSDEKLYLFNPGSISLGSPKSYGIMEITDNGIFVNHATI